MKKYNYFGSSTLSFTYQGNDYLVHGKGPHSLPEEAPQIISAVGLSLLVEKETELVNQTKK